MNPLLQQISDHAAADLPALIIEHADEIMKAIGKAEEEAILNETKPKFVLGFRIVSDLDKRTFECALSWAFRKTVSVSHQIEDVNQQQLSV